MVFQGRFFKGIDVDRLKALGNASTRPIMDNDTPEGRAKNRRMEFILASGEGDDDGNAVFSLLIGKLPLRGKDRLNPVLP